MQTRMPSACLVLLALIMGGCAGRTYQEDGAPPVTEPRAVYATQVAMGSCVFKPQPEAAVLGAIGAALLSSAVSQGVNYLGKAITEAAKENTDRVTAVRNVEVTSETFGPCFQVARGWFFEGFATATERAKALGVAETTWARAGQDQAVDEGRLTLLWQRRMWIAAQPDFVLEAEIVPSSAEKPNERVLTMAPVYARLEAPISQAVLRPSRARDVAAFFAFADAKVDPSVSERPGSGLVLGRLEPGKALVFAPPESDTTFQPNRGPLESKWFTISVGKDKEPMTIAALVTEHQDAQPFLQFVADVFSGAKEPITTALQTAVVPPLRAAAEETRQSTRETQRTAYESALVAALSAVETCAQGVTDPVGTASGIRGKVRTLNAAARANGRGEFDESAVPLSTNAAAVQAGCVAMRGQLRAEVNA